MTVKGLRYVSRGWNGVGAFILQCRKMEFTYCDHGGSSDGMRKYIKKLLRNFAAKHPQIEFSISPRPYQHPLITGYYINGGKKPICVRNLDILQVAKKVELLRDANGEKLKRVTKPVTSINPSVRGIWSPYHGADSRV